MHREKLDPQMIDVLEIQEKRSLSLDRIDNTSVAEARDLYTRERAYWNADPPALPSIEEFWIDGPVGDIKIRRYLPYNNQTLPCLIYLHGGGFMMCNLDNARSNHAYSGHRVKTRRRGCRLSSCPRVSVSHSPE